MLSKMNTAAGNIILHISRHMCVKFVKAIPTRAVSGCVICEWWALKNNATSFSKVVVLGWPPKFIWVFLYHLMKNTNKLFVQPSIFLPSIGSRWIPFIILCNTCYCSRVGSPFSEITNNSLELPWTFHRWVFFSPHVPVSPCLKYFIKIFWHLIVQVLQLISGCCWVIPVLHMRTLKLERWPPGPCWSDW